MAREHLDEDDIYHMEKDNQPKLKISLIKGFTAEIMEHWEMDKHGIWGSIEGRKGRVFFPYTSIYIAETIVEDKK